MIDPKEYGLTEEEYKVILGNLGREPNLVELGIYSAMWSEHCSYKHTKSLLKKLPSLSNFVVQGPGENAGVVSINEDWNLVFKIESHNHPSLVAPYDGAATGVGGLFRDIIAMGARPVGVKTLLRFGNLSIPSNAKLIKEVRKGATYYSSECEVASLGEELFTHPSFSNNPLVNVIVIGLAKTNSLMRSSAGEQGNRFVYFGRPTSSDGVNGASFASQGINETIKARPPAGDALIGKDLMKASLLLIESGFVEGLQDMGAAGLTSSSFEMAHKAGRGFEMNLDDLPKTNEQISGYELMLSETQERMLASVKPQNIDAVMRILADFPSLSSCVVGRIISEQQAIITYHSQVIAHLSIQSVADGFIHYQIAGEKNTDYETQSLEELKYDVDIVASIQVNTRKKGGHFNASDLTCQSNKLFYDPCSAILLPDIKKVILLRTLSNGAEILQDPYQSVHSLVSQAYNDIEFQGAQPIALSDCVNSGDPDDPKTAYQIIEGIRGLSDACRDLSIPVIGGNVSLYNSTNEKSILSQFMIGMVGIMDMEE